MRLSTLLLFAAVALGAAGSASAKPASPAKPASGAAARPPAKSPALDVRDPASLIQVLTGLGAKGQVVKREGDAVFLAVTSPTEVFSAQFAGCDPKGHACQAVLFDRQATAGAPTLAQLNSFNQASVMCRLYQDKAGQAHLQYSALLFPREGRPELLMHINAWRGCLSDFAAFVKDPTGFLASAQ